MTREQVIKGLEELRDHLFHEYKVCYHGDEEDVYRQFLVVDDALLLICKQQEQLEEAEPVKHGRWEVWSRPGDEETGNCSVCKTTYSTEELFMGGTEFPKYCPECGARMDEEVDDGSK